MVEGTNGQTEVKDTDIIFDCPHCGKSLAIDYRGAGLTIPCTDCGNSVQVPIPEGMEISDIDSSEEEQEMQILNLRRSLAAAELRIESLEAEIAELNARREVLESGRTEQMASTAMVREKAMVVRRAAREITEVVEALLRAGHQPGDQAAEGGRLQSPGKGQSTQRLDTVDTH